MSYPALFTAAEVRRLTGVPYETLNYWARAGVLSPSVSLARGSGSRRVYDLQDLVAIRVALKLRRAGIFGKVMPGVLGVLRQAGFDSPVTVMIDVTANGNAVVRTGARRRPGQLVLDFTCDCRKEVAAVRRLLASAGGGTAA